MIEYGCRIFIWLQLLRKLHLDKLVCKSSEPLTIDLKFREDYSYLNCQLKQFMDNFSSLFLDKYFDYISRNGEFLISISHFSMPHFYPIRLFPLRFANIFSVYSKWFSSCNQVLCDSVGLSSGCILNYAKLQYDKYLLAFIPILYSLVS